MWFAESAGNRIGRITMTGAITEFPLPTAGSSPAGIAAGPDGAMWFTQRNGNRIGRITMAGVITEFAVPTADSTPWGIAAGPDGAMWFTQRIGNKIGRIDMAGAVTEFPVPTPASAPWEIAAGVDGSMWFSEWETSRIARVGTGRGALLVARVTGRRSVGARLTCARTNRSPWAVASTSYTWMRGGTAIRGATRRTYTVAPRDSGRRISCRAAVTLRPALTRFGAQSRAVPIR
jgi:streptogramin lyase